MDSHLQIITNMAHTSNTYSRQQKTVYILSCIQLANIQREFQLLLFNFQQFKNLINSQNFNHQLKYKLQNLNSKNKKMQSNLFQYGFSNNTSTVGNIFHDGQQKSGDIEKVKYTSFDALPNYQQGVNLPNVLVQIEKSFSQGATSWRKNFDAIDNIRILNKYHPAETSKIFAKFWKRLDACFKKPKTTYVMKNLLFYVQEVFQNGKKFTLHEDIIKGCIPKIINKTCSKYKHIQTLAKQILQQFVVINYQYNASIYITCYLSFNKKTLFAQYSLQLLAKILQNSGKNISKYSQLTIELMLKSLVKILQERRNTKMVNWTNQILLHIYKQVGEKNFTLCLKKTLNPAGLKLVMDSMQNYVRHSQNNGPKTYKDNRDQYRQNRVLREITSTGSLPCNSTHNIQQSRSMGFENCNYNQSNNLFG